MLRSEEEILADIDRTFDQLIQNAFALKQIAEYEAFSSECATLHKTQHSLMGRVLHMQELLCSLGHNLDIRDKKELHEKIQEKISRYKQLNNQMLKSISQYFSYPAMPVQKKTPRIGRNRKRPLSPITR